MYALKRVVLATLCFCALPQDEARAQASELEALGFNYAVTFLQQVVGKVWHGPDQPLVEDITQAAYESLPSAVLSYAGMKLVAEDWRFALPAQVLAQKGAWVGRRSMQGLCVYCRDFLVEWELDYLWFNLRLRDGRFLLPRANAVTLVMTGVVERFMPELSMSWQESLLTGTVVYTGGALSGGAEGRRGIHFGGVVALAEIGDREVLQHELLHDHQVVRGSTLWDVGFRQDFSQEPDYRYVRLNLGDATNGINSLVQFLVRGSTIPFQEKVNEWEVLAYVCPRTGGFCASQ